MVGVGSATIPYLGDYVAAGSSFINLTVNPSVDSFGRFLGDALGAALPALGPIGSLKRIERMQNARDLEKFDDIVESQKLLPAPQERKLLPAPKEGAITKKYVQQSPIDYDHVLKADYTKKKKPTGGHTLLYGDVKIVPGTESAPDVAGVYRATIQVPDPKSPGQWITKTSNNSTNTMFPKSWDEARVKMEVDKAWNDPNKIIQGDKWKSVTPSGVKVEGWISPRVTVYPIYQSPK